jgi:hypothetical protein
MKPLPRRRRPRTNVTGSRGISAGCLVLGLLWSLGAAAQPGGAPGAGGASADDAGAAGTEAVTAVPPASPRTPGAPTAPAAPGDARAAPQAGAATPRIPPASQTPATFRELDCGDGEDDDGDGLVDCADADCSTTRRCQATGVPERSDALCSDWVDNDGDGATDCDDHDCQAEDVRVCQGSYPTPASPPLPTVDRTAPEATGGTPPPRAEARADADGERTDELCSDGIDNDLDGVADCADLGCRLDPEVSVCTGTPGLRFTAYLSAGVTRLLEDTRPTPLASTDARLRVLQLRALGPIRGVEGSFFLLTLRAEQSPRVAYALVRLPLGTGGRYVALASGGANLSLAQTLSASRLLLLDPARQLRQPFEQGGAVSLEIGGPLESRHRTLARAFAGGSPATSGAAPTRRGTQSPWTVGGQLFVRVLGAPSPFDGQLLYTPAAPALALYLGARYDEREQERFPAASLGLALRGGRLLLLGEAFGKRELGFRSTQAAFDAIAGLLVIPRRLLVGAEYGALLVGALEAPPEAGPAALDLAVGRQRDESQARAVLHAFLHRGVGIVSLRYSRRTVRTSRVGEASFRTQELLLSAACRF